MCTVHPAGTFTAILNAENMEYKVVPVTPVMNRRQTLDDVGKDFEFVINKYAAQGWNYVRLENLHIWVAVGGCFGFFSTGGYYEIKHMLVFSK